MERIVLMGGPCSGQIFDVEDDGAESVDAVDAAGGRHVYVRTELVDLSEDVRAVIFTLAAPS